MRQSLSDDSEKINVLLKKKILRIWLGKKQQKTNAQERRHLYDSARKNKLGANRKGHLDICN